MFGAIKIDFVKEVININNIDVSTAWYIGDILYDFELAQKIRYKHVIISNGHHTFDRLKESASNVVKNLMRITDIIKYFFKKKP